MATKRMLKCFDSLEDHDCMVDEDMRAAQDYLANRHDTSFLDEKLQDLMNRGWTGHELYDRAFWDCYDCYPTDLERAIRHYSEVHANE